MLMVVVNQIMALHRTFLDGEPPTASRHEGRGVPSRGEVMGVPTPGMRETTSRAAVDRSNKATADSFLG